MRSPSYIADFDSSTAMLRATGNFLHGRDFPSLGLSTLLNPPTKLVNLLPTPLRKAVYVMSGWNEAVPPRKLDTVDDQTLSRWVASRYPRGRYPAVAIGASNGAAVHLHAALGIPWLPQTFLIPVRQRTPPYDPAQALRIALDPADTILRRNPDLRLHHMHDPVQDELMVRTMTYFRVKRLRLGEAYRRFLTERLEPGGTIMVMDCTLTWATRKVADRYVFQPGAVGGISEDEYLHGSPRVAAHLRDVGAEQRLWEPPQPDSRHAEAEWGFEPALLDEIQELARERGYRVLRVAYPQPHDLSPLVADLYRWWYRRRGIPADRLLVESFVVLEPWWTLRTGSVPFWMVFNTESSLAAAHDYLDTTDPFDEIYLMLFNHGVESIGLAGADQWRTLLGRARQRGYWTGGDPTKFPSDFAQFARYNKAVQKIPARYPMPEPLSLDQLDTFLAEQGDRYPVRWERLTSPAGV